MDLNSLIPDNSENWNISKEQLLYKRCGINIPVCKIYNNIIFIFLDNSAFHKPLIKLVNHITKLNIEFYFLPPAYSNPSATFRKDDVIYHYLISYANNYFNDGFEKIGFDLIENMVKWCKLENCFNLIKINYLKAQKKVQYSSYNYHSRKRDYDYNEYIRDEFNSLYRHILISQII